MDTPQKFNPLKKDAWKTILSFWEGNFSRAMLNFRWVQFLSHTVYDLINSAPDLHAKLRSPHRRLNHNKSGNF